MVPAGYGKSGASQISKYVKAGVSYPIAQTVKHMQPGLSWSRARQHGVALFVISERYGVDWKLLLAIAFQESSLLTRRFFNGPLHVSGKLWGNLCDIRGARKNLTLGYECGTVVLGHYKWKYGRRDPLWIGRYHSWRPYRKLKYYISIQKHLVKIDRFLERVMK